MSKMLGIVLHFNDPCRSPFIHLRMHVNVYKQEERRAEEEREMCGLCIPT